MDNPFSADNSNPFLTPYQAAGATPAASGIKPFNAVDLAPPAGMNGNRMSAPPPLAPTASPFAGADLGNAFLSRETPLQAAPYGATAATAAPATLAHAFAPAMPANAAPVVNPFTSKPVAAPSAPPDFTPVPERAVAWEERPAVPAPVAAPVAAPVRMPAPVAAAAPMKHDAPESHAAKPGFLLTTGHNLEGHRIGAYLGVVSVEIVIPKDILFRNPAPYGELHRIKAAEDQLQKVKQKAFEELGDRARALGADGIVGATLQFSQFDAVVFLCAAVGTAVRIG